MEKVITQVRAKRWLGRISNASPHTLPPGAAQIQENLRTQKPGQIDVRPGVRSTGVSASGNVIAVITRPDSANGDKLLVHDDSGAVNALTPS